MRLRLASVVLAIAWLSAAPAAADLSVGADARIRIDVSARSLREDPPGLRALAAAGDVNGDGRPDVVVSDPLGNAAYVVFGRPGLSSVRAGAAGSGFAIRGRGAGRAVSGAGDVNGDGLADVVVTGSARAYVVFGSATAQTVRLAALGGRGIVIDGIGFGTAAGAGDVNGDGRADIVAGAFPDGRTPRAAVIFGGGAGEVDARRPGLRGFSIRGSRDDIDLGGVLAAAGDVNGDGRGDVLLGVPDAVRPPAPGAPGGAWLVLGDTPTDALELPSSARAVRITGAADSQHTGAAVAGAGDVNGDGLADIAIGVPVRPFDVQTLDSTGGGSSYVLYGSRSPLPFDLGALGERGFRLDAAGIGEGFGYALAGGTLVGAPGFELREGLPEAAGAAYLLRGTAVTEAIRGLPGDRAGAAVATPGDLDGDGQDDLLVLTPRSCDGAHRRGGETVARHVIRVIGVTPGLPGRIPVTRRCPYGGSGADVLTGTRAGDFLRGNGGDDVLRGGVGTDVVFGGAGDDRLSGGPGADTLDGGLGRDVLDARDGVRDDVRCGPGRDSARVDRRDRVLACEQVRRATQKG